MFHNVASKSVQTSVLAALLFYVFANPDTFKMVKKLPGFKFVMKGATEITHEGVLAHAVVFGLFFLACVWLINTTLVKQNLGLNVVENYDDQ